MDGAGLALALFAELRTLVKSIQERKACYKEVPALFAHVDRSLCRLTAVVEDISTTIGANPDALPRTLHQAFVDTLSTVNETLAQAENTVKLHCADAVSEIRTCTCFPIIAKNCRRFRKSKSMKASILIIQHQIGDAEGKLQILCTQLSMALKVDDLRGVIKEHVTPGETFRPAFNAPMLPGKVFLDFKSKDTRGNFAAPEATLKSLVLISASARPATKARCATIANSAQCCVHGVAGMPGVGKTIALIALGHESDIRAHFSDGVLYISVGAAATETHITNELCRIMRVSGASTSATEVQSSKSLSEAVSNAAVWFHEKRVLFLIDDIWSTPKRPEGYLPELEGLLQGSPESRIVFSTRYLEIASKNGSHVDFGARATCGLTSLAIFLAHALPSTTPSDRLLEPARPILILCAGLPISLSVAGAAVGLCVDSGDDFDDACETYLENIQSQISMHPGTSFLNNAIRFSIATLAEDLERSGRVVHKATSYSLSELYISLCVLENQQFAPITVLARMWGLSNAQAYDVCVSFKSMSLVKVSTQKLAGRKQRGLNIHDLHLEFCRERAAQTKQQQLWHNRLLDGHMTPNIDFNEGVDWRTDQLDFQMLEYKPRPWWKDDALNKEYMRKHLSRHLRGAGLDLELGATLLDLRWINAQGQSGGLLGLKNDFDNLETAVEEKLSSQKDDVAEYRIRAHVRLVSRVIASVSTSLQQGLRILSHDFLCYFSFLSNTDDWVHRFLESVKEAAPKPLLVPLVSFYEHQGEDLKFDIDLRPRVYKDYVGLSTDFSTCERYAGTGANHDVVVSSLETQNGLKILKGHKENVSVVKFTSNAQNLISGSLDHDVIIWDWQNSDSPSFVLSGHYGTVTALSLSNGDAHVLSGSVDKTVKVWEVSTGRMRRSLSFTAEVECVAASPKTEIVAVGSRDGHLHGVNWVSGERVFNRTMSASDAVTAAQFRSDGEVLICGGRAGKVFVMSRAGWKTIASVEMSGGVSHVSFHPDGLNVLLGFSRSEAPRSEVRNWNIASGEVSTYNVATVHPLNGLSLQSKGKIIALGTDDGFVRGWSGPKSNPNLDFADFRRNMLHDFSLSADGGRVATTSYDSMIRIWSTETGAEIATYEAPGDGCRRLGLSGDGAMVAAASPAGELRVWNPAVVPRDTDIRFQVDAITITCISFSPDGQTLLLSSGDEVQVWDIGAREKRAQIPSFGSLDAGFSSDGQFIIVGNSTRTTIRNATTKELVFDSSEIQPQTLSLSDAKSVLHASGPSAIRMCPIDLRASESSAGSAHCATELTVSNIFNFVTYHIRPMHMEFCSDVFALSCWGKLIIFKLQK